MCLTGSLPLQEYLNLITEVGFGTVEVRAKRTLGQEHVFVSPSTYFYDGGAAARAVAGLATDLVYN